MYILQPNRARNTRPSDISILKWIYMKIIHLVTNRQYIFLVYNNHRSLNRVDMHIYSGIRYMYVSYNTDQVHLLKCGGVMCSRDITLMGWTPVLGYEVFNYFIAR